MNVETDDDGNPFFDALPPAVRAAIEAQDVQALDLALRAMPRDEAEALARWLVIAGVLVQRSEVELDAEQRAAYYPPAVAAALASGDADAIFAALAELPEDEADRLYEQLHEKGLL